MINNKIIESELKDLRNDIYDLFLRINQLKNEVHKMKIENKPIYEQYKTIIKNETRYTFKNRSDRDLKIINLVRSPKGSRCFRKYYYNNHCGDMAISTYTTEIIETYIPSKELVLVVEL